MNVGISMSEGQTGEKSVYRYDTIVSIGDEKVGFELVLALILNSVEIGNGHLKSELRNRHLLLYVLTF
jgi:hypothetical protein